MEFAAKDLGGSARVSSMAARVRDASGTWGAWVAAAPIYGQFWRITDDVPEGAIEFEVST